MLVDTDIKPIQTRDLIKKGLRLIYILDTRPVSCIQTRDLIKKGLRPRQFLVSLYFDIQTRDLIKKGLRPSFP